MLSSLSAYKSFLISCLLAAYVAGAFHMPAMEALHVAAHVVEHLLQPLRHQHFHTHHGHESEQHAHDHEHPGLSLLDQVLDGATQDHDHTAPQHTHEPKKKNPELLPLVPQAGTAEACRRVKPELELFALLTYRRPIPEPPPEGLQLWA